MPNPASFPRDHMMTERRVCEGEIVMNAAQNKRKRRERRLEGWFLSRSTM